MKIKTATLTLYIWMFCSLCANSYGSNIAIKHSIIAGSESPVYIDIHFGNLRGLSADRLLDILAKLQDLSEFQRHGVEFRKFEGSETTRLVESLQDKSVIGIVWMGHPAIDLRGESIVNSALQTASGRYVPKGILSAAHSELRFFGFIVCHDRDLIPRYSSAILDSSRLKIYQAPNINVQLSKPNESNPLFLLASIFTAANDVFENIAKDLNEFRLTNMDRSQPEQKHPNDPAILEIDFRDLKSARYDYEVLLDGQLIGVLQPQQSTRGRIQNRSTARLLLPARRIQQGSTLQIRPDDSKRTPPVGIQNVIDDILIDQIRLEIPGQTPVELLREPVHIGDNEDNWDREIALFSIINDDDFRRYPPRSALEIKLW